MAAKQTTRWHKIRKFFGDLHLWAGLTGGVFLFVICLTGTIYTFQDEIKRALEPRLYEVTVPEASGALPPEALVAAAEQHTGRKAVSILLPGGAGEAVTIGIENATGKGRPENFQLNPYTGEVLGIREKGKGSDALMVIFRMHRWLLLDTETGRPLVGIATILFCFGCLTGLVIWFPRKLKNWKQGLKIKRRAGWKRLNHDLHNALGFYAFAFLLLMGLTGLCWSFEGYKNSVSALLGAPVFGAAKEGGKPGGAGQSAGSEKERPVPEKAPAGPSVALSQVAAVAHQSFPYPGTVRIGLPKKPGGPYEVAKIKNGFFSGGVADRLKVNGRSGQVEKTERFADKPLGAQVAASIRPLHTGEIFGTFSKILYFISCLIATSLPVTGTLIWWNKLQKKRRKKSTPPRIAAVPSGEAVAAG